MEIQEDRKLDVLLAQLNERYTALHNMRDRSMQFALWILGLGLGLAWLLISEVSLSKLQAGILVVFLIVVGRLCFGFIQGIECGFNNNRNIMINIEKMLGLHSRDAYGSPEPVLPEAFCGNTTKQSGHFPTLNRLLWAVFALLVILAVVNPCRSSPMKEPATKTAEPASVKN